MAARALCVLSFNCRQIELERGGCKRLFCGFSLFVKGYFPSQKASCRLPLSSYQLSVGHIDQLTN